MGEIPAGLTLRVGLAAEVLEGLHSFNGCIYAAERNGGDEHKT
jgi:hypothetical protein